MLCDENKDYCKSALEHLKNAETLAPSRNQVYATLTGVYLKMGDYKEAKGAFERAVALGFIPTDSSNAYMQIGFMYAQIKDYDASLKYYEMALNADKSNIQILESIALVESEKGDIEKARITANQIKEIYPNEAAKVDAFLKILEQSKK
jgi:pentatricopeptide repeat protein